MHLRHQALRLFALIALFPPLLFAGALHDAARSGDIAEVKRLLATGGDINERDGNDATPLHWAAYAGHTLLARLLIERGADVYANENQICLVPFQTAAAEQSPQANAQIPNGVTPLHWAAAGGYGSTAELLIAEGANVNAETNEGLTPLGTAVLSDHQDVILLLKRHGAR
jgi:uncharacterized protein